MNRAIAFVSAHFDAAIRVAQAIALTTVALAIFDLADAVRMHGDDISRSIDSVRKACQ